MVFKDVKIDSLNLEKIIAISFDKEFLKKH